MAATAPAGRRADGVEVGIGRGDALLEAIHVGAASEADHVRRACRGIFHERVPPARALVVEIFAACALGRSIVRSVISVLGGQIAPVAAETLDLEIVTNPAIGGDRAAGSAEERALKQHGPTSAAATESTGAAPTAIAATAPSAPGAPTAAITALAAARFALLSRIAGSARAAVLRIARVVSLTPVSAAC